MVNNEINIPNKLKNNNSLLIDDEKILNLLQQILTEKKAKGNYYKIPESIDEIPQKTFAKMQEIDKDEYLPGEFEVSGLSLQGNIVLNRAKKSMENAEAMIRLGM